jgi:ribosome-associated protein
MIEISPGTNINENELRFDYIRASGPGGQNVNKVASAAQLRFDVRNSSLPEEVRIRLIQLGGKRVSHDGILLIEAKQFRTQEQNREDAIRRLVDLVRRASLKSKTRRKTKPTKASKEERLKGKKRRGEIKKNRQGGLYE